MTCLSKAGHYIDSEYGYFDVERMGTLSVLAEEINGYLQNGKPFYPAFPPKANHEMLYAWNLEDPDDGDIYPELMAEIQKLWASITA